MTTLIAHTPAASAPIFILDLLATFTDDAVSDVEANGLIRQCLTRIRHLGQRAPDKKFATCPPIPVAPKCFRRFARGFTARNGLYAQQERL